MQNHLTQIQKQVILAITCFLFKPRRKVGAGRVNYLSSAQGGQARQIARGTARQNFPLLITQEQGGEVKGKTLWQSYLLCWNY